jgi:prepilin-type N-terminal cleavage/methylation domain-containing protein
MSSRRSGLTLTELLIVTAVMGILSVAIAGLLSASLDAHKEGSSRFELQREGLMAMERMTDAARRCTFLITPNAHQAERKVLALSGFVNDDDDYYFDDPLFPRIDEDLSWDMNEDGYNGIEGLDEDKDGLHDEFTALFLAADDDEDGWPDEDPLNGLDDDGDGNVDEDCSWDMNWDGAPGIAGIDDDGDGLVDEGHDGDDDEDGSLDELGLHPIVFRFKDTSDKLVERNPRTGERVELSNHVEDFLVEYQDPQLITITLVLRKGDFVVTFVEDVCLRNSQQKTGKRVR